MKAETLSRKTLTKNAQMTEGVTLILIIGILAILSMLSVLYIGITATSISISQDWIYRTRSFNAASSGIEYAVSQAVKLVATSGATGQLGSEWAFWGEDLNKNGILDPGEDINNNGILDTYTADIEQPVLPSFAKEEITIGDKKRFVSGFLDRSSSAIETFIIKMTDTSGKFCISSLSYSNLLILNNLFSITGTPVNIFSLPIDEINRKIAESPKGIEEAIKEYIGNDNYARIQPYITTTCNKQKVVRAVPESLRKLKSGTKIYSLQELLPEGVTFEWRAPVNINIASKEVLEAILSNISALYFKEELRSEQLSFEAKDIPKYWSLSVLFYTPDLMKKLFELKRVSNPPILGTIEKVTITPELAQKVAVEIMKRRKEKAFSSWIDFNNFMDGLVKKGVLTQVEADLIKANSNPNTDLNKLNPNSIIYKLVDKTDIIANTTEFTFYPSGTFKIEALGYVLNPKTNGILAETKLAAEVVLYNTINLSTQRDFFEGTISDAENISTANGKTLQVLPGELMFDKSFEGDGQLQLASVNTNDIKEKITFYAGFAKGLDADLAEGDKKIGWDKKTNKRILIFPDGAYSGSGHPLVYHAPKNFPTSKYDIVFGSAYEMCKMYESIPIFQGTCGSILQGTLSFWIKPAFNVSKSYKLRTIFTINNRLPSGKIAFNSLVFIPKHLIELTSGIKGVPIVTPVWGWSAFNVGFYLVAPTSPEEVLKTREWTHIALSWDTSKVRPPIKGARIYINGEDKTFGLDANYYVEKIRSFVYAAPDFVTNNKFYLGAAEDIPSWNFPAEATYDEIIFTMGQRSPESIQDEFNHGRYFNGSEAIYTSKMNRGKQHIFSVIPTLYQPEGTSIKLMLNILDETGKVISSKEITNGGIVNVVTPETFYYQLVFKNTEPNKPILISPILDDITFVILNSGGKIFNFVRY